MCTVSRVDTHRISVDLVEPLPHDLRLSRVANVGGEEVKVAALFRERAEVVVAEEDDWGEGLRGGGGLWGW